MKLSSIQFSTVVVALLLSIYFVYHVMNSSSPETIHATTMPAETSGPPYIRSPDPALEAQADRRINQLQQQQATPVVTENEYEEPAEELRDDSVARAQWEEEQKVQMEISEDVSQRSPSSATPSQLPDSVDDKEESFLSNTVKNEMIHTVEQIRDNYASMDQDMTTEKQTEIEFLNELLIKFDEKRK